MINEFFNSAYEAIVKEEEELNAIFDLNKEYYNRKKLKVDTLINMHFQER